MTDKLTVKGMLQSGRVESPVRPPLGCGMPPVRLLLTVACRNLQACITPELTGRETFDQASNLIPLRLNELLCRPLIVSLNCRSRLPSPIHSTLDVLCTADPAVLRLKYV